MQEIFDGAVRACVVSMVAKDGKGDFDLLPENERNEYWRKAAQQIRDDLALVGTV